MKLSSIIYQIVCASFKMRLFIARGKRNYFFLHLVILQSNCKARLWIMCNHICVNEPKKKKKQRINGQCKSKSSHRVTLDRKRWITDWNAAFFLQKEFLIQINTHTINRYELIIRQFVKIAKSFLYSKIFLNAKCNVVFSRIT